MKTTLKDFIYDLANDISFNLKYQCVSFDLPSYTGRLLAHYGWESKIVDPDEFVVNTLKSFINENCKNIKRGDIQEVLPCINITFIIPIPRLLLIKMWWVSLKTRVTLSSILHEALGYSLPYLMDLEQELEDSALNDANVDNNNIMEQNND